MTNIGENGCSGTDYEDNFAKYLVALNRANRQCLEDAFSLLYHAWGCGKGYANLQEYCIEVLGWKKSDLVNLFYEAQMRHFSISSRNRSYSSSHSKVATPYSPLLSDDDNAFDFSSRTTTEAVGFDSAHLIKSTSNIKPKNNVKETRNSTGFQNESHRFSFPRNLVQGISEVESADSIQNDVINKELHHNQRIFQKDHQLPQDYRLTSSLVQESTSKSPDVEVGTKMSDPVKRMSSATTKVSIANMEENRLKITSPDISAAVKPVKKPLGEEKIPSESGDSTNSVEVVLGLSYSLHNAICITQPVHEVTYMTHPIQKATCFIQEVSSVTPTNAEVLHGKLNHESNHKQQVPITEVSPDLKLLPECLGANEPSTKDAVFTAVMEEAVHNLHYNPSDPLSLHKVSDLNHCFLLDSETDPSKLPEKVLVLLLTEVFPGVPPAAVHFIKRLKHLAYVVCYMDYKFDKDLLKKKIDDLYILICDLISVVIQSCRNVIDKYIKEASKKLRSSKRRLRSVKRSYGEHRGLVLKTREDLEEAERELQEAQEMNARIEAGVPEVCDFSSASSEKSLTNGMSASPNLIKKSMNSDHVPLANDSDEIVFKQDDSETSLGLLTSVMDEVAVIERKHSNGAVSGDRIKKLIRNTRQSVIMTKKDVRDRLDSNVSAEQDAIAKEDLVNEKQLETNRLSKKLKTLRKSQKNLNADELAIQERIRKDLHIIESIENTKNYLSEGHLLLKKVRTGKLGMLLSSSRKEAIEFASRITVFDIREWIIRKRHVKQEIHNVYSRLQVKDSEESMDILDILRTDDSSPTIIVLTGPKGSGKTCMCHYILHQWKLNKYPANSKIHEFDLVLYTTLNNILSSGTWSQYLREHVFCVTLNDLSDADILESLNTMTVLILLDVSTITPAGLNILDDIFKNLKGNKLIVTARPGSEQELIETARNYDINFIKAKVCPMATEAIKDYASQLMSMSEQKNIQKETAQFINLLNSMNLVDNLMYPLYVTYLVFLWNIEPGYVLHSTSVSRLFTQVTLACQHDLIEVIRHKSGADRETAKNLVQNYTNQLCETAWHFMTRENWQEGIAVVIDENNELFQEPTVLNSFHPLVAVREIPGGKKQGILPHPALAEILCGFYFASKLLCYKKGLIQRRPKIEVYFKPDVKRYRDVMPHVAGALVYNKHSAEDAKEIVTIYGKALSSNGDMSSWLTLLKECDFLSSMCSSVASELSQHSTWSVSNHSRSKNNIVADLLRKSAYQPKQVIISNTLQKDSNSVDAIIRSLSTCSSTLVHLRQELQFYTWGEEATCDAQVIPLQPPGTLQDCWGHLGKEGALALRHSHHLEELNVRISSCEALGALSHSLAHLRLTLRYLYLRLDISSSTPVSEFPPLQFKGKKLWLRLRKIDDDSVTWVMEVLMKLSNWYTEVVLEESRLSPPVLHSLKASLPHTSVHVSG